MEKVHVQRQYLLGYHDVYNDNSSDPAHTLTNIPQLAALESISNLLHLYNIRQKVDLRFQSRHLYEWMMKTTGESKCQLLLFIQRYQSLINSQNFKLIDRRPCLDLIQHILVYTNPNDNSPLDASHHTILLKCLLYFNDVENKAQEKLFKWEKGQGLSAFVDNILVFQFRNIGFTRFKHYQIEFLKAFYLFDFCKFHEVYSAYLATFLNSLGLPSYRSYLWRVFEPYLKFIETGQFKINDEKISDFYRQLSISRPIEKIDQDYQIMRRFPLFQIQRDTYIFMNYHFFIDKLYQGFLFDFAKRAAITFDKLKRDMGNLFSEKILFDTIMKKCFNSYGDVRLNSEELKTKLKEGEPDYYMRESTKLFVFEFKDAIINAKDKYSADPNNIKSCIMDKFEVSKKGKKKGITQLMNTVVNIKNNVFNEVDLTNWENIVIYPVIVHTDITLESHGVNYFLNDRFEILARQNGILPDKLKKLILINLDTLIHLQDYFLNGKLVLSECIDSYIKYVSTEDPVTATFPFDEFVKYHIVELYGEKIKMPREFYEITSRFEREANIDS